MYIEIYILYKIQSTHARSYLESYSFRRNCATTAQSSAKSKSQTICKKVLRFCFEALLVEQSATSSVLTLLLPRTLFLI